MFDVDKSGGGWLEGIFQNIRLSSYVSRDMFKPRGLSQAIGKFPIFVNKGLLEQGHAHSSEFCQWLCSIKQ